MEYSKITYYAALFANDLRHIDLHAAGPSRDDIRNVSESLIYEVTSNFEDLAKLAIIHGEKVGNINAIRSYVPDTEWHSPEEDAIDFNMFVQYLNTNGLQYLNALKTVSDKEIADRISYWETEILYNNGQRMATIKVEEPVPETPVELVNTPQNPLSMDAVVIAVPDWRSLGASSALSQSILGNN